MKKIIGVIVSSLLCALLAIIIIAVISLRSPSAEEAFCSKFLINNQKLLFPENSSDQSLKLEVDESSHNNMFDLSTKTLRHNGYCQFSISGVSDLGLVNVYWEETNGPESFRVLSVVRIDDQGRTRSVWPQSN